MAATDRPMMSFDAIRSHARAVQDDTVALRRAIHADPELGLDLPRTRARVLEALAPLPLEVFEHETTSGVVAVLRGASDGPTILLRGDMDALRLTEDSGLPYAATGDLMHACGHDIHTAMLAGAARVLSEMRAELSGSVVFMFQPGEEGHHGARFMLEEGLLDVTGTEPERAMAIHVLNPLTAGTVSLRSGPVMASADEVKIEVTGSGGHASMPHLAVDPVPILAEIVLAVETAVTRRVPVSDPAVVTFGLMRAGTTHNVIPERARLHGTMRTLSAERRGMVQRTIRTVAGSIAEAHGAVADVDFVEGYPVTVNETATTDRVESLAAGLGVEVVRMPAPMMGAEDWSYVLERVPGAMVFLGASPPGADAAGAPSNHSNRVVFEESVMATGVALYAAFGLSR